LRVQQLFDLSGRTALVTGGGRGIGRYIALGLAEAGADVVIASRKIENCDAAAREIEALGRRAIAVEADLSDSKQVEALAERALSEFERLDVLVNNAGVIWGAPTLEYPMKGWDKVFDVNVRALNSLTLDMAVKLAPHKIRVNAIAPGPFDTDMMDHVRHSPEELEAFLRRVPLRRPGGADDAKAAAVYLASDASAFVTGHVLVVDGGMSARY